MRAQAPSLSFAPVFVALAIGEAARRIPCRSFRFRQKSSFLVAGSGSRERLGWRLMLISSGFCLTFRVGFPRWRQMSKKRSKFG
jgi:hypothetical protein